MTNPVKMLVGIALLVLGAWRLIGGPTASPLALLPDRLGMILAVAAVAVGFWLYRSSCGT